MRWLESLQAKLLAAVCGVALVSIGVFAWVNIRYEQGERVDLMIRDASQFSDTVKRSTHYAMLQNRWEDAFHIMDTIGNQEGVLRVRVFSKEGMILFSTDRSEVGSTVDKQAEACYACQAAQRPLERLDLPERARIFAGAGGRILGMITPIANERGCAGVGSHLLPVLDGVRRLAGPGDGGLRNLRPGGPVPAHLSGGHPRGTSGRGPRLAGGPLDPGIGCRRLARIKLAR